MKLCLDSIKDRASWESIGISVPDYNVADVVKHTKSAPKWVHFGVGNIFRIFIGGIADTLIGMGEMETGIICAETFDCDIIEQIYVPYDNLVLSVTLNADGTMKKRVIGSLNEAICADHQKIHEWKRLEEIFANPNLQMVSLTITEKGYTLKDSDGMYLSLVKRDMECGPKEPVGTIAVVTSFIYERFRHSKAPIALVSMDNCSHNGERLKSAVLEMTKAWMERGLVEREFLEYLADEEKVSFPWSMIDKITPRPSKEIAELLEQSGVEQMQPIVTEKGTYIAPFVNAEGPQYLVIEDHFPNGRPPLEKAGVYMTTRSVVNEVERMKVTTCLNPLHTALAVYGCILGYHSIAEEMQDADLVRLVSGIGPKEGMRVVCDPGILSPEEFVKEVMEERLPNRFIPDSPQRIATDTSQKVGIRFGETIKSYVERYGTASNLTYIPLAIAGWLRYLMGLNDHGMHMQCSPDPMMEELQKQMSKIIFGKPESTGHALKQILSNKNLFGINLYEAGIGDKIETMFREMIAGPGAVRSVLQKYC